MHYAVLQMRRAALHAADTSFVADEFVQEIYGPWPATAGTGIVEIGATRQLLNSRNPRKLMVPRALRVYIYRHA